jgi:hypothetical protein
VAPTDSSPEEEALLAAMRGDLDAVRDQLDLLPDAHLTVLRDAAGELEQEVTFALRQRADR